MKQSSNLLCSNYYLVKQKKDTVLLEYKTKITKDGKNHDIGLGNMEPERKKMFSQLVRKAITEAFKVFNNIGRLYLNELLYISYNGAEQSVPGDIIELGQVEFEGQEVSLQLQKNELVPQDDIRINNIIGRIMKQTSQKQLSLRKVGRKFFNPQDSVDFKEKKISIIRGYDINICQKSQKLFLQIESCIKTVRKESYLDVITQNKQNLDKLKGETVMTSYNHNFYRVEEICLDLQPSSSFEDRQGKSHTYLEYYSKAHNITITNLNQPLIKVSFKRRGKDAIVYLIPELCQPTGETEQMRNDFNFQRDISKVKHLTAYEKLDQNNKYKELLTAEILKHRDQWNLEISQNPVTLSETRISPGSLKMGEKQISIETANLDRETQSKMLRLPFNGHGLSYVQIIYSRNGQQIFGNVMQQLQQSSSEMNFPILNEPLSTVIQNENNADEWIKAVNSKSQLVILLLAGPKKNGKFYKELKRHCINNIGVPSQVLLQSTARNQKGLRTVINKLLVQITAKTQGVPYTVTEIPEQFSKFPTMVCGIDIYHKASAGKQSILGLVASIDQTYGLYTSERQVMDSNLDVSSGICQAFDKVISTFIKKNGIAPSNIIVYRDGVSGGQKDAVLDTEVKAINNLLEKYAQKTVQKQPPKLIFTLVNKRINTKFYLMQSDNIKAAQSAATGTVVDSTVTENKSDFYIISQKVRQGVAIPTYYSVISENDQPIDSQLLQDLKIFTYKLCYLYFNLTGSIKVPAPIQYAHRLSNFVGDLYDHRNPGQTLITPVNMLNYNTLYFI